METEHPLNKSSNSQTLKEENTEEKFLKGKQFQIKKPILNPPLNQEGLLSVIQNGYWKDVLILSVKMDTNDSKFAKVISLFRLRNYDALTTTIPDLYSNINEAPFTIQLIHATIPHYKGTTNLALESLYLLLSRVKKENNLVSKETTNPTARIREERILFTIINCHLALKQNHLAIQIMEMISEKYKNDTILLTNLGLLYLFSGNLNKCIEIFKKVEEKEEPDSIRIHLNQGYIYFAKGMYQSSIDEFSIVLKKDPKNLIASNNLAICYFFTKNIQKSIEIVEELIRQDPENTIDEQMVFNLCMFYNLENQDPNNKKKIIKSLIQKFKGDDFHTLL